MLVPSEQLLEINMVFIWRNMINCVSCCASCVGVTLIRWMPLLYCLTTKLSLDKINTHCLKGFATYINTVFSSYIKKLVPV